ncbi:hypothetical protein ANTPLA_LOCUS1115 [Anthophora plagiata]
MDYRWWESRGLPGRTVSVEWGSHGLRAHNRRVYGRDHVAPAYLWLYNRGPITHCGVNKSNIFLKNTFENYIRRSAKPLIQKSREKD